MDVLEYADLLLRIQSIPKRIPGVIYQPIASVNHHTKSYELGMVTLGNGPRQICLAAGIHGDEPAGPEALVRFMEGMAGTGGEPPKYAIPFKDMTVIILPCNNPSGLDQGTRQNRDGIDLNRKFGTKEPPPEVMGVQNALEGRVLDLFADFHEDTDGQGFYLYEVCDHQKGYKAIGKDLIRVLSDTWRPDPREEIDGFESKGSIINPEMPGDRGRGADGLPLPVYLYFKGVGHCLTLETPTALPFEERVQIHLKGLEVILRLTGVMV